MIAHRQFGSTAALVCTGLCCAGLLLSTRYYSATDALASKLEQRFAMPIATHMATVEGIIALGGGHARIVEAVRLAKQYPNAKLVVTGASPDDEAYAQTQGLPAGQLLLESRAKNTFENAIFSRDLVAPIPTIDMAPRHLGCTYAARRRGIQGGWFFCRCVARFRSTDSCG